MAELTASRTVALQDAFAQNPSVAFAAVLHAMVLTTFHHMRTESCVELSLNRVYFPFQAAGLRESPPVKAMTVRFDGYGDSGQIEDVEVRAGEEDAELPPTNVEIARTDFHSDEIERLTQPLNDAVETVSYELLEEKHGGRENNAGA